MATPLDAFAIAAVHTASWRAAYRHIMPPRVLEALSVETRVTGWLHRLGPGGSRVWVAEQDGDVLGFVSAGASRDADASPRVGEVYSLYVHPARWGGGAGGALLARAVESFLQRGQRDVTLWVLDENTRARRFYISAGFSLDGATQVERSAGVRLPQVRYRKRT